MTVEVPSRAIDRAALKGKKNRAFGILMIGSSISMSGTRISTIAFPMLILNLSGSPFMAGLVGFAAIAPSLLMYIPAGALVDRWDPWKTLVRSDILRGIAVATVIVPLAMRRHPSIILLMIAMLAEEILEIFSTLAERRYISLVKHDDTSHAQACVEARSHAVVLAGRPFGVFLFKIAPILPFAADGISFIFSTASLVYIKIKHTAIECPKRRPTRLLWSDMRKGISWFRHDMYALVNVVLLAGTTLVGQALILIFLALAHADRFSSFAIGVVLAASGAGGALGSLLAKQVLARVKPPWPKIQVCIWTLALGGLSVLGPRSFVWIAFATAILGLTGAIGNITFGTYLVTSVKDDMLARVSSTGQALGIAASAVGPLIGGVIIQGSNFREAVSWLALFALALVTFSFVTLGLPSRTGGEFSS